MSGARFLIGDTRHVLAGLPDGSVDLVLTSPTRVRPVTDPMRTVTASDDRPLLVDAPTASAADSTSLLVPYYGNGRAAPVTQPMATVTTRDRQALVGPELDLDECTFRMLEPHEVGAAMAFPATYRVDGTKKDRVRLYGNAWTPPVGTWIIGRVAQALEAAA